MSAAVCPSCGCGPRFSGRVVWCSQCGWTDEPAKGAAYVPCFSPRQALERAAAMGANCATWEVRNAALSALEVLECAGWDAVTVREVGEAFGILSGARWPAFDAALIDAVVTACGGSAVMS